MQDDGEKPTALVTGAGRGIGRAIALSLAHRGYATALSSRSQGELDQVAEECRRQGAPHASVHVADMGRREDADRLATEASEVLGRVDVLVNNAGFGAPGNAADGDPDEWARMMEVNLNSPMRLTRHLAPSMIARERGTIINIGSIAAVEGMTNSGAYAAAKHGLRGWSLSCYRHLRGYGIKVTLINPAFVDTGMVRDRPGVRPERMLRPQDVADAAMLAITTSAACCPEEITLRLTRYAYG